MFYLNLLENPQSPKSNFWTLWLFLLLLIIIGCLTSCITQEKCNQRYPTKDSTYVKDSIICLRDTIYLEPESFAIHDTVSKDCPDYHHTATNGHTTATIDIKAGHLTVTCHEDSLMRIIEGQTHTLNTYRSKSAQTIREVVIKIPWYATFCIWWFVLTIICLLLFILWSWMSKKIPF